MLLYLKKSIDQRNIIHVTIPYSPKQEKTFRVPKCFDILIAVHSIKIQKSFHIFASVDGENNPQRTKSTPTIKCTQEQIESQVVGGN